MIAFCFLAAVILSVLPVLADGKGANVHVIPIKKTVEKGLYAFLDRTITEAEENNADLIIFDMHTPGGEVDAAQQIANRILRTEVKTVTFINSWAISAGSFIALHTDEIYMTPNAAMGAAAVIDQAGNTAGEKADSMWIATMAGAADQGGRNSEIAKAMATKDIDLPDLKKKRDSININCRSGIKSRVFRRYGKEY